MFDVSSWPNVCALGWMSSGKHSSLFVASVVGDEEETFRHLVVVEGLAGAADGMVDAVVSLPSPFQTFFPSSPTTRQNKLERLSLAI
jgi:hypothetical protein